MKTATLLNLLSLVSGRLSGLARDTLQGMQRDFSSWNWERIAKLQKYSWSNGNRHFKYYWYDKGAEKAYFFDFDI